MANAALAIVEMQIARTASTTEEAKTEIVSLIEKSYKADKNNPLTLKLIAEHHFQKGNFQIASDICDFALNVLESYRRPDSIAKENQTFRKDIELLKSEIYFILGKVKHVQQAYTEAQEFYLKATKCNEKNLAAQFNLGKIYFHNQIYNQAEQCFETIVYTPKHKDCFEALRLLAQTKNMLKNFPAAVELFKRVIELNPKDLDATIEIAQIYEYNDSRTALVYYEKALQIARSNVAEAKKLGVEGVVVVPPEILINVGTFSLEVGKISEAMGSYEEAIAAINQLLTNKNTGEDKEKLLAMKITARFNVAFAFEQLDQCDKAERLYKEILDEEPTYLDAYLRLAYMKRDKGKHEEAL